MPTLHWIGKEKVVNHHLDVPYRVLEHQYGFEAATGKTDAPTHSGNKIIHGDNLEALKSLLPEYEGKVKCIYIDPPYNTGNEGWVYNDNVNDPKIRKWLEQVVGKEGEDLSRHDKWLCMMYPRLRLLHRLLSEDGAIFISIDDNEQANMRLILDEIFGRFNFVDTIIWQKIFAPKNAARFFSANHDFIICYAKDQNRWSRNLLKREDTQNDRYSNPDNDPRGVWTSDNLTARNPYNAGLFSITTPNGRFIEGPPKGTYWRISEPKYQELLADNRIWFGQKGDGVPRLKRFLSEVQQGMVPQTIWSHTEVGNTQEAKKEFNQLLHDVDLHFDTPKPVRLLTRILQLASSENSVVLDAFAGSGTTAHAVLNLNQQDNGNRKFILIEMEDYAETITAERVKRVMQGYGEGKNATEGTGGAFDYYTLGPALFDAEGNLNEAVGTEKIRAYVWYSETRSAFQEPTGPEPYLLGKAEDTAYYFVYEPDALTCLDFDLLASMATQAGQYVIYADNCLLTKEFLAQNNIVFKKIPRDISRF
ncbi:MAG: hypothetical protein RLZZ165_776 [Bacteroidota bacterium]